MQRLARCAALAALVIGSAAVRAEVVSHLDRSSGVTFISLRGVAPAPASARAYAGTRAQIEVPASASPPVGRARQPPAELLALAQDAARGASVDPHLLMAVVDVESGWNAQAHSEKGAMGLMQLMPATARSLGVTDAYDPAQSLRAGAAHLGGLLSRFQGDATLALAAYNAGEGAVMRHGLRVPPFAETQAYVPQVLGRYQRYRDGLAGMRMQPGGLAGRAPERLRGAVIVSYR